ncbi:MAG: YbaB/EbfC family nucleoid-associated protein [Patescibacteria group bacterium]
MFDKLKKVNQLRKLKNSLKDEVSEVEEDGVRVKVNGQMKIEEVEISPELTKKKQEDTLTSCINNALQKAQMKAAQKMSELQD